MTRLSEIRELSDGWLGAGSLAPNARIVNWIELHSNLVASSLNAVSLIPVGDGAIALQWKASGCEYTAELRPDDQMYLYIDNTVTDEFDEKTTTLSAEFLEKFIATGALA